MCSLLAQICMKSMLFLLFTVPICGQEEFELPVVQTRNGRIRGFRIQLEPPSTLEAAVIYRQADIFLGIPFAQAPVGPLRLERPLPAANWTVTLDASSIPPACVPVHVLAAPDFSEDCLYLNVFRPFSPVADKSFPQQRRQQQFPVLVFIHGGGFCVGGSFVEGYNNISNNFVSQGILVVSIQYRLNFLGFFSDGSAQNPGNLGLWDQRQALLWIRENIALFGGDPGRVTVWGQSAGAASVSFLSISPHSRDLFHQAIQQSGSFLSPWAMNDRVVEVCQKTASTLGCAIGRAKNKDQRQCLEEVQIDDLVDAIQQLEMVRSDFAMVVYNPRADDDFVPKDIGRALTTAPKKPTLMGFNRHESMFLTIHYPVSVFAFDSPLTVADVHSYNRSQLVNFIRSCVKLEQQNGTGSEEWSEQIARRLEAFYADGEVKGSTATWRHFLEQYTLLLTDVQFLVPILAEARLKAAQGWPLFLYQFDHINREHAKKLPFRGIVHAAEYPYTLGAELFGNYQLDDDDRLVQASLLRAYGTFVKTGIPQPSLPNSTDWRPTIGLGPDSPLHILRFGQDTKPHLETDPVELIEKIRFWRSLSREKGFSRVNGFPKIIP